MTVAMLVTVWMYRFIEMYMMMYSGIVYSS